MSGLLEAAREIYPQTVELRRALHRRPEQGLHLPETRRTVLEALEGLPLEITRHRTTSGVAAVLRGGRPGPTIILRGDMDALPLQEDTGLPFASEKPGSMHACGHDLHTAMLAGAARLLSGMRDELSGSVIFMFQPGEEGYFGARYMLEEGVLDTAGDRPTGAFAVHVVSWFPSGTFHHRPGPQMASADRFEVTVRGKGGHASAPHLSRDPVPAAAEMVSAFQTAVTRRVNVFDPGVITVTLLDAGTTHNIIPETARLMGTIRALSEATREELRSAVRRVAQNAAAAHLVEAEVEIERGYGVTLNDPACTEFVDSVAKSALGGGRVEILEAPSMGGEDWSYVLREVPGVMTYLGACPPGMAPEEAPSNHSNRVVFHEEAMIYGMALHAAVALAHGRGGFSP